jgi:hypothetical protein
VLEAVAVLKVRLLKTSLLQTSLLKSDIVVQQGEHVVTRQLLSALQKIEFNHESQACDSSPEAFG